jgi:hypothetical protein
MKENENFPDLDFSGLLNPAFDYAVHCTSDAQALHFIREVRRQYPRNAWSHDDTRFGNADQIAYSPYLNRGKRMTWDSLDHYKNRDFVIVEFTDLLSPDIDIQESDLPVELLLGGQ